MMVAGGLGERLGYTGLKVALPTETVSGKSYLAHYIETILNYQDHARRATDNPSLELPLAIMTSEDTDARTRELLRENNNFGMAEGQVTLLKQGKVPSLLDNDGHIALDDSGFGIQTKVRSPRLMVGCSQSSLYSINVPCSCWFDGQAARPRRCALTSSPLRHGHKVDRGGADSHLHLPGHELLCTAIRAGWFGGLRKS